MTAATHPHEQFFDDAYIMQEIPQYFKVSKELATQRREAVKDYLHHVKGIASAYYGMMQENQSLTRESIPEHLAPILLSGVIDVDSGRTVERTRVVGDDEWVQEVEVVFESSKWNLAMETTAVGEKTLKMSVEDIFQELGSIHAEYMRDGIVKHFTPIESTPPTPYSRFNSYITPTLSDDKVGERVIAAHHKDAEYNRNNNHMAEDALLLLDMWKMESEALLERVMKEIILPALPLTQGQVMLNSSWVQAFDEEETGFTRQPDSEGEGGQWISRLAINVIEGPIRETVEFTPSPMRLKGLVSTSYSRNEREVIRDALYEDFASRAKELVARSEAAQKRFDERFVKALKSFMRELD